MGIGTGRIRRRDLAANDLAQKTLYETDVEVAEDGSIVYRPVFTYRNSTLVEDPAKGWVRKPLGGNVPVVKDKYSDASIIIINGMYGKNWEHFDSGDLACDAVRSYNFLQDIEEGKLTSFIAYSLSTGNIDLPELDPSTALLARASGYALEDISLSMPGLGLKNCVYHIVGINKYIVENFSRIIKSKVRAFREVNL
ncbi:MAG: hypothetical protein Q7S27_03225 [Nanoarchaeota archaeon]|nr:hypothetical protein [Nanoarchaeota archaeon]